MAMRRFPPPLLQPAGNASMRSHRAMPRSTPTHFPATRTGCSPAPTSSSQAANGTRRCSRISSRAETSMRRTPPPWPVPGTGLPCTSGARRQPCVQIRSSPSWPVCGACAVGRWCESPGATSGASRTSRRPSRTLQISQTPSSPRASTGCTNGSAPTSGPRSGSPANPSSSLSSRSASSVPAS